MVSFNCINVTVRNHHPSAYYQQRSTPQDALKKKKRFNYGQRRQYTVQLTATATRGTLMLTEPIEAEGSQRSVSSYAVCGEVPI